MLKDIEPETPLKFMSHVGAQELNLMRPALQNYYGTVNRMQVLKDKYEKEV